jgi:hypothetical protein
LIRQPYDLYRAGVLDEYFMGLMNQVAQAMDDSVTQEVSEPNLSVQTTTTQLKTLKFSEYFIQSGHAVPNGTTNFNIFINY